MGLNIGQWYKDAPPTGKIIMIASGVAVLVVGYIAASQLISSLKQKAKEQKAQKEIVGFNNDLNQLQKSGVKATYQQSQYNQWADSIVQQFQGCDTSSYKLDFSWLLKDWGVVSAKANDPSNYSNSGAAVLRIIQQLKNNADFLALQVAFGSRTYKGCGMLGTWFAGNVGPVTLTSAVIDELSSGEIAALNEVLKGQNITYTF